MKGAILVFGLGLMLLAAVATAWVATTRPSADYTHTVNTVSRAARRLPTHTNSGTGTGTGAGAGAAVRLFNRRHESPVEDDGYSYTNSRKMSWLRRTIANLMDRKKPGTLILIRHGETLLNSNKTFTGWMDPDLSEDGVIEIEHAARLMLERGYDVDMVYTSRLKRAIRSAWILIIGLNQVYKPVYKSWRLNERMYGAMEGLSKPQMAAELGEEVVQGFRRGLYDRPPPMTPDHPHWHKNERKYSDLAPYEIPITESLQDTLDRTVPLWKKRILPALASGRNVCIVAHANSLRGIVKIIENIPPEDIPSVVIPNGIPLVYKFDKKMKPVPQANAVAPLRGEFLEKKGISLTLNSFCQQSCN